MNLSEHFSKQIKRCKCIRIEIENVMTQFDECF